MSIPAAYSSADIPAAYLAAGESDEAHRARDKVTAPAFRREPMCVSQLARIGGLTVGCYDVAGDSRFRLQAQVLGDLAAGGTLMGLALLIGGCEVGPQLLDRWLSLGVCSRSSFRAALTSVWRHLEFPSAYRPVAWWVDQWRISGEGSPLTVPVLAWRGAGEPFIGMSWTRKRDDAYAYALREARRSGQRTKIVQTLLEPTAVLADLEGRDFSGHIDRELVVDPGRLGSVAVVGHASPDDPWYWS